MEIHPLIKQIPHRFKFVDPSYKITKLLKNKAEMVINTLIDKNTVLDDYNTSKLNEIMTTLIDLHNKGIFDLNHF